MIFVIFHGAFSTPQSNWFPEIKKRLESLGQVVLVPQFPCDSEAELTGHGSGSKIQKLTLKNWLAAFEEVQRQFKPGEKLCFIGHSLGCVFILQIVAQYKIHLDSAIFVGPFLDCLPTEVWPYTQIISDFQKTDLDPIEMKKLIPTSYVLYSNTDPYVPNKQSLVFAKILDSSTIMLRKAGHMNAEVNLDEFSLVLDLCLTRLDLSYTQKYKFINRKIGAFGYIKSQPDSGTISLETWDAFNEGLFNFSNIDEVGFATLFSSLKEYSDPHSQYMESSRNAAKRMDSFTRVIVLDKISDLNKASVREQIRADLASTIKIFLCKYGDIKNTVPIPDFGIWDNRYVVTTVPANKRANRSSKIVISSTKESLAEAKKWQKEVMKHTFLIKDPDKDIKDFLAKQV